jgi:hypothetical protein
MELVDAIDQVEVRPSDRPYLPMTRSLFDFLGEIQGFADIPVTSEREVMRFISWDSRLGPSGRVIASPIILGDHDMVSYNYDKFSTTEIDPLLQIHNHPGGGFLSLQDLELLVTGPIVQGKQLRNINGVMVVSDRVQLLGLATNRTPIFSLSTWRDLVKNGWELMQEYQLINKRLEYAFGSKEMAESAIKLYYFDKIAPQGMSPVAEDPELKLLMDFIQQQLIEEHKALTRDMMTLCVDFFGIKLYSSTDFGTFKEFSA